MKRVLLFKNNIGYLISYSNELQINDSKTCQIGTHIIDDLDGITSIDDNDITWYQSNFYSNSWILRTGHGGHTLIFEVGSIDSFYNYYRLNYNLDINVDDAIPGIELPCNISLFYFEYDQFQYALHIDNIVAVLSIHEIDEINFQKFNNKLHLFYRNQYIPVINDTLEKKKAIIVMPILFNGEYNTWALSLNYYPVVSTLSKKERLDFYCNEKELLSYVLTSQTI